MSDYDYLKDFDVEGVFDFCGLRRPKQTTTIVGQIYGSCPNCFGNRAEIRCECGVTHERIAALEIEVKELRMLLGDLQMLEDGGE